MKMANRNRYKKKDSVFIKNKKRTCNINSCILFSEDAGFDLVLQTILIYAINNGNCPITIKIEPTKKYPCPEAN
jgi:hypothetical protein